jgi:hypothetical protein
MSGNVTGNDTGNVSRTSNHIISNEIKLVNRNLVQNGIQWFSCVRATQAEDFQPKGGVLCLRQQTQSPLELPARLAAGQSKSLPKIHLRA